ncbi:hypothetical protein [Pseudomonas brassicacearum]|uniref:Uncharacterized protein n=1 Tax=Pseudomonas brassicacearum subsp. neoaurantiaca TaxID=494916 RepID=A0A7V8UDZ2_9PSED|nr:hypothetical protein [Pseudomonas brassicacearum]MBA1379808.1 hypothetical protein [Pseudomonas brassicacearum subsp. neoaurantiaca]
MTEGTQTFSVSDDHIQYKIPQNVQDAYDIVLDVANRVLRQCKLFSIESLQEENPTVGEIARRLHFICGLMQQLDECSGLEGEATVQKAHEYAKHVQALANAIEKGDVMALDHECNELNRRSFI